MPSLFVVVCIDTCVVDIPFVRPVILFVSVHDPMTTTTMIGTRRPVQLVEWLVLRRRTMRDRTVPLWRHGTTLWDDVDLSIRYGHRPPWPNDTFDISYTRH